MNRLILLGAAICLGACAALPPSGGDFRISNFRQGLVGYDAAGNGSIVVDGNDFPYAINGTCVANGQRIPCMWHGFEFTYQASSDVNVLNCRVDSSVPFNLVDPRGSYGSGTTVNFSLTFKGRQGHFFNPQYKSSPVTGDAYFHEVTRCESGGKEVLRFEFTVRAPSNQARASGPWLS